MMNVTGLEFEFNCSEIDGDFPFYRDQYLAISAVDHLGQKKVSDLMNLGELE